MYECYKTINNVSFWAARFQDKKKADNWLNRQKEGVVVDRPKQLMKEYWGVEK